jgi:F420-non-reducing hydrogenase iron-sulfur subunit
VGECHYLYGNVHVAKEMEVVKKLLDLSGIGSDRLCLRWVSAAEGQLFAEYATQFTEAIRSLGPLDPLQHEMELEAVETALTSRRLRWLMGIELSLARKGNVFGESLPGERYRERLQQATEGEYHRALVSAVIQREPLSVREIAFLTGLPAYTVSLQLGELERQHEVEIQSYQGTTPRFLRKVHEALERSTRDTRGSHLEESGPQAVQRALEAGMESFREEPRRRAN